MRCNFWPCLCLNKVETLQRIVCNSYWWLFKTAIWILFQHNCETTHRHECGWVIIMLLLDQLLIYILQNDFLVTSYILLLMFPLWLCLHDCSVIYLWETTIFFYHAFIEVKDLVCLWYEVLCLLVNTMWIKYFLEVLLNHWQGKFCKPAATHSCVWVVRGICIHTDCWPTSEMYSELLVIFSYIHVYTDGSKVNSKVNN